jgi:NAD(P)H-flavin reductase
LSPGASVSRLCVRLCTRYWPIVLNMAKWSCSMVYASELQRWRARFDLQVEVTLDTATGDWRGNVGVVTALIPRAAFNPLDSIALMCGPEVMMRFTAFDLLKQGMSPEQIYVSMERNMKCAVGFCGHCQYGPAFVCKDGPVFRYDRVERLLKIREV